MTGIHLSTPRWVPTSARARRRSRPDEQAYLDHVARWDETERGYSAIQSTRPQTLGYGLNDSPVGLAAWLVEKWRAWSDSGGDVDAHIGRDNLLTTITLYWATGSITSSMRDYVDNRWHGISVGPTTGCGSPPPWRCSPTSSFRRESRRACSTSASIRSVAGPSSRAGGTSPQPRSQTCSRPT